MLYIFIPVELCLKSVCKLRVEYAVTYNPFIGATRNPVILNLFDLLTVRHHLDECRKLSFGDCGLLSLTFSLIFIRSIFNHVNDTAYNGETLPVKSKREERGSARYSKRRTLYADSLLIKCPIACIDH